jgi:hypothetical protein
MLIGKSPARHETPYSIFVRVWLSKNKTDPDPHEEYLLPRHAKITTTYNVANYLPHCNIYLTGIGLLCIWKEDGNKFVIPQGYSDEKPESFRNSPVTSY